MGSGGKGFSRECSIGPTRSLVTKEASTVAKLVAGHALPTVRHAKSSMPNDVDALVVAPNRILGRTYFRVL